MELSLVDASEILVLTGQTTKTYLSPSPIDRCLVHIGEFVCR